MRQKTWDAYFDDLLTRKKPNAWEIGITTRWHEDDIAGRILPASYAGESGWIDGRDGNRWYVVCIPAEAEHANDVLGRQVGERIWPEWFGPSFPPVQAQPAHVGGAVPAASGAGGGRLLQVGLAASGREPPPGQTAAHLRRLGTRSPPRRRLHGACGGRPRCRGTHVSARSWRRRAAADEWVEAFCDLVLTWRPIGSAEEQGQIRSGVGPFLARRMRERGAFVARQQFAARGDKAVRAQSMRGRMALDGLYVPARAPWLPTSAPNSSSFPAGRHDDQVDAIGLVGQLLSRWWRRRSRRRRPGPCATVGQAVCGSRPSHQLESRVS